MSEKGYFTLKWILGTFGLLFASVWLSFGLAFAVRTDSVYSVWLTLSVPLLLFLVGIPVWKKGSHLQLFQIRKNQRILTLVLYAVCAPLILLIISRIENWPYALHLFVISVSEEFYCRGVLNREFRKHYSPAASLWIVSLMFAFLFHMDEPLLQNLWLRLPVGLGLGYAYNKTGNLWIPVLMHTIFNASVIILYSGGSI